VIQASGKEPDLIRAAWQRRAGIFACEGYNIISNVNVAIVPGEVETYSIGGSLKVQYGGEYNTALNAPVFIRVWKAVAQIGAYRAYDWAVKLDADSVFFPERLRMLVSNTGIGGPGIPGGPVWLSNTQWGLFGPIEVLSRDAFSRMAANLGGRCSSPPLDGREDVFMRQCMEDIGVQRVNEWDSLLSNFQYNCKAKAVCIHPFKDAGSWLSCHTTATQQGWWPQVPEEFKGVRARLGACEDMQADDITGRWEDVNGQWQQGYNKFYGGAPIVISKEAWHPEVSASSSWGRSSFSLKQQCGVWYLIETDAAHHEHHHEVHLRDGQLWVGRWRLTRAEEVEAAEEEEAEADAKGSTEVTLVGLQDDKKAAEADGSPTSDDAQEAAGKQQTSYYKAEVGSCCCPAEEIIETWRDCKSALVALGLKLTTSYIGRRADLPGGCSWRVPYYPGAQGETLHFNSNVDASQSREDLSPICRRVRKQATTTTTTLADDSAEESGNSASVNASSLNISINASRNNSEGSVSRRRAGPMSRTSNDAEDENSSDEADSLRFLAHSKRQ